VKVKNVYKKYIPLALIPAGLVLAYITSLYPSFTEKWYSNGLNRYITKILSNISDIFPFAVSEILVILGVVFLLWMFIRAIISIVRNKGRRTKMTFRLVLGIVSVASIIYFVDVSLWGLNYNRQPFSVIAGLDVKDAPVQELAAMCEDIIERTNTLRLEVSEDENGVMRLSTSKRVMFKNAVKGFEEAGRIYPELAGRYGRPKGASFSELMSYQNITGMFTFYTGEALVNTSAPDSLMPSTTCHEMVHQRGFAREDEANFIAYIACSLHPDKDFRYSGMLLAMIHSMNALYRADYDRFASLYDKYGEGVKRDLQYNREYWKKYEGIVEKVSDKLNDSYLKANGQEDGVQSYGRMVDLLLAHYR
jgi:hypothetical protein